MHGRKNIKFLYVIVLARRFCKTFQPPRLLWPRFLCFFFRDLPDGFQDDFSIRYNLFFPTGLHLIIENARKKNNTRRPCASMSMDHTMSQMSTVHVLPNHYLDKHFNIILQFTPRSLKQYSSYGFLQQNPVFIHILYKSITCPYGQGIQHAWN